MKKEFGEYYVGFDIGTDSVGWAVTDKRYNILKLNGKAMWGIRLFESGKTAQERRAYRTGRRRLARRKLRIQILQELFDKEIAKADDGFFMRLNDSNYLPQDKTTTQKYSLFNDEYYKDYDYHKAYPTIYHLRKAFIDGDDIKDVRLLYIAVAHIIKNRGHFLFGEESMEIATDFNSLFSQMNAVLSDEIGVAFSDSVRDEFASCIKEKLSVTEKKKRLEQFIEADASQKKELITLLAGGSAKLAKLFSDEALTDELEAAEIKSFSIAQGYDENYDNVASVLGERMYLIECLKAVYDWGMLTELLGGEKYLSFAKVKQYHKHKEDLKILKSVVRKYIPGEYSKIFNSRNTACNYVAYTGKSYSDGRKKVIESKAVTQTEFCSFLKKLFKGVDAEDEMLSYILEGIENNTLLPKQRSKDNCVIPHQLHLQELKLILKNALVNFPFLGTADENGIKLCDKIISLFCFRIPYYVGPLNDAHKDSGQCWIVKKDTQKRILPWNFEECVDTAASAEAFIRRMTSKCTYLTGEDVLPKNSISYSRFAVLNELNNVKVNGVSLCIELKQKLFDELFLTRKKVSEGMLKRSLADNGVYDKNTDVISGTDGDFKANMASYIDFKGLLGDRYNEDYSEEAIWAVTLFANDKKILRHRLKQIGNGFFTDDEIKKICTMRYDGWGRLSHKLIKGIPDINKKTGECRFLSITDALYNTTHNFMQLLTSEYGFMDGINEHNEEFSDEKPFTYNALVKDLYVSPAVKRGIWQTLSLMKEIKGITGHAPEKIFIEVAREHMQEKKRTVSRKAQLLELYSACKKEASELYNSLNNTEENSLRSDKLYLYYTQMGRCMYSGEPIDLDTLLNNNSMYDIDHIYPQSKVKDDSLDNRVLVKKQLNLDKGDAFPLKKEIREKNTPMWNMLFKKGLISKTKLARLTRCTEFTEQELADFIARQLVETRQSTKAVADILKKLFPESDIVYVKAGNVSDFKHDYELLKDRDVNDLHHAKDAYVNIVVGNVYDVKFTENPINFIQNFKNEKYSMRRMFDYNVERNGNVAWITGEGGTISTVKKVYEKNNIQFTRYAYENTGALFDLNPLKKGKGQLPLKGTDEEAIKKYGGYNNLYGAYFCLVEHTEKKGRVRTIEYVPIYLSKAIAEDASVLDKYLVEKFGLKEHKVLIPKIKINTTFCIDGFYLHLSGRSGERIVLKNAMQLCLDKELYKYSKRVLKFVNYTKNINQNAVPERYDAEINAENNIKLFEYLTCKMKTVYATFFKSAGEKADVEKFKAMTVKEQCNILALIFAVLKCNSVYCDLSGVGSNKTAGFILINKNITKLDSISIINQSPTGLFREIIDLKRL